MITCHMLLTRCTANLLNGAAVSMHNQTTENGGMWDSGVMVPSILNLSTGWK
jgi:hypothetical protein